MIASTPSGLLPAECSATLLISEALDHCVRCLGGSAESALHRLRSGDPAVHSLFRYALARGIGRHLGQLGVCFHAIYVYGSAMQDTANPCSDIDLIAVIRSRCDEVVRLLRRLDTAILAGYRVLMAGAPTPDLLLDVRFVEADEEQVCGYGSVLSGPGQSAVCLWRSTPEARRGPVNRAPLRSSRASRGALIRH